jgi:hypothetical protein
LFASPRVFPAPRTPAPYMRGGENTGTGISRGSGAWAPPAGRFPRTPRPGPRGHLSAKVKESRPACPALAEAKRLPCPCPAHGHHEETRTIQPAQPSKPSIRQTGVSRTDRSECGINGVIMPRNDPARQTRTMQNPVILHKAPPDLPRTRSPGAARPPRKDERWGLSPISAAMGDSEPAAAPGASDRAKGPAACHLATSHCQPPTGDRVTVARARMTIAPLSARPPL